MNSHYINILKTAAGENGSFDISEMNKLIRLVELRYVRVAKGTSGKQRNFKKAVSFFDKNNKFAIILKRWSVTPDQISYSSMSVHQIIMNKYFLCYALFSINSNMFENKAWNKIVCKIHTRYSTSQSFVRKTEFDLKDNRFWLNWFKYIESHYVGTSLDIVRYMYAVS